MINFLKKTMGKMSLRFLNKSNFTVFLFHEITNNPSKFQKKNQLYHSIDEFVYLLNWIKKNYEILSPLEIERLDQNNSLLKKKIALITFDDGYEGSFTNGLPILIKDNLPSIHFLNMFPIVNKRPNLVSLIDYLKTSSQSFEKFLRTKNLSDSTIYKITPKLLEEFMQNSINNINFDDILHYQGKNISLENLNNYKDNNLVFYGNHFYDHWNTLILNEDEIKDQYLTNEKYLKKYSNYINYFAFTHGAPHTNYNLDNLKYILSLKPSKIFCVTGGTNPNKDFSKMSKILARTYISKNELDNGIFGYRLLRGNILKKQYKNYFN